MSAPLQTYPELRPKLLDSVALVTWLGDGALPDAIKHFKPGGSHSSICFGLYGSLYLAEALADGFDLSVASERFSAYDGAIYLQILPLTPDQQRILMRTMMQMLAKRLRYGYWTLLQLAWRKVKMVMTSGVCSQDAEYILAEAGVIPPQTDVLSPGELKTLLEARGVEAGQMAPYLFLPD